MTGTLDTLVIGGFNEKVRETDLNFWSSKSTDLRGENLGTTCCTAFNQKPQWSPRGFPQRNFLKEGPVSGMLFGSESSVGSGMSTFRDGRVSCLSSEVRASRTTKSGSSSLSIKLSRGTKPLSNHMEAGGWRMGMPPAAARRQHPPSLIPHHLPHGDSRSDRAAPPSLPPRNQPAPGRGAERLTESRPGRCSTAGQGASGASTWGREQGTGAPGDPQHCPDGAAAAAAGGYSAAPRAGAGGDREPPPPVPLAPPALSSASCAGAPLPGDRHCQAEPRPLRAGIGCRSRWPRLQAAPSCARAHAAPASSRSGEEASGAGLGFLRGGARSLRSWALQCPSPGPAQEWLTRRPERKETEKISSLGEDSGCRSSGVES